MFRVPVWEGQPGEHGLVFLNQQGGQDDRR